MEGTLESTDGKRRRWACGYTNTIPETTDLPLCLTLKPSNLDNTEKGGGPERSLCLATNNDREYPTWCYNRVPLFPYGCSYYLWWSPCERCGTAWRMHEYIDDDVSAYKLPTPEYDTAINATKNFVPDWNATNFTNGWLHWNYETEGWESSAMTVEPCQDPLRECVVDFYDKSGDDVDGVWQSDLELLDHCERMDVINRNILGFMDEAEKMSPWLFVGIMAGVCLGGAVMALVCSLFGSQGHDPMHSTNQGWGGGGGGGGGDGGGGGGGGGC